MLSIFLTVSVLTIGVFSATPVVFWHGVGDWCCDPNSVGGLKDNTSAALGGSYVLSLQIGGNAVQEEIDAVFVHPNKQVKEACDVIAADEKLKDGFNAIGISQGGVLIRGLIQRCPAAKVKKLITLGSPHQGIYGVPNCPPTQSIFAPLCDSIRKLLSNLAYDKLPQDLIVQANYWHSPLIEDRYRSSPSFLANINNELNINQTYVDKLQSLEKFVMIQFDNDRTIIPNESTWFGFYKDGQSVLTETLEESRIFKEDRLGLRKMKEDGKLDFVKTKGGHVIFPWEWFQKAVVDAYLKE